MKRLSALLVLAVAICVLDVPMQGQAPCDVTVDPDYDSVSNAVDKASSGDVICLNPSPGGRVTWNKGKDITDGGKKYLEIRGAGVMPLFGSAGKTVIYNNAGILLGSWEAKGGNVTVSNLHILYDSKSPVPGDFGQLTWNKQPGSKPWIVHHNTFEILDDVGGYKPKFIVVAGHGGVIYRNDFINYPQASSNYTTTNQVVIQHIITDDGSWWDRDHTQGDADKDGMGNLYVESNRFYGFNVALDQNTSSRVVWRYNEMHSASTSDHGLDSSTYGTRHGEYYGNTFFCDRIVNMQDWISKRGGTAMIFNNVFPALDRNFCNYNNDGVWNIEFTQYYLFSGVNVTCWPGTYPTSYPGTHQMGYGYAKGRNSAIGADQSFPVYEQAIEPYYIWGNTRNNSTDLVSVTLPGTADCGALAKSNQGKSIGTTLTVTTYANAGQGLVAAFTDLVGGSAPTISTSPSQSGCWTSLTGSTNGSMRLSAWYCTVATGGKITVTFTFDSSSAARAGVVTAIRNVDSTSAVDMNPSVTTDNTSPYAATTGRLSQSNEIVLGYFALNGPTAMSGNSDFDNDIVEADASNGDRRAVSCGRCATATYIGINGTTGSTATTNVTIGMTYQIVSSMSSVTTQFKNPTANRNGLAGVVSLKLRGSPHPNLADWIADNREYFKDEGASCARGAGTCSGGIGIGTLAQRPTNCVAGSGRTPGVGWWATDKGGNWRTQKPDGTADANANDGALYVCTATNTWKLYYTPYVYPHNLARVTGSGVSIR